MNSQCAFQLSFDFLRSKPIVVEPSAAQVTSDAGLLPFRQLDEQIGLTRQFADALDDRRHASYLDHTFLEMTRMRVYGVLTDYADQYFRSAPRLETGDPRYAWVNRTLFVAEGRMPGVRGVEYRVYRVR